MTLVNYFFWFPFRQDRLITQGISFHTKFRYLFTSIGTLTQWKYIIPGWHPTGGKTWKEKNIWRKIFDFHCFSLPKDFWRDAAQIHIRCSCGWNCERYRFPMASLCYRQPFFVIDQHSAFYFDTIISEKDEMPSAVYMEAPTKWLLPCLVRWLLLISPM